jgi:hypothetical protein
VCVKFNARAKEMDVTLCRLVLWLDPPYRDGVPCDDTQFKYLLKEVRSGIQSCRFQIVQAFCA